VPSIQGVTFVFTRIPLLVIVALLFTVPSAWAQNWSFDARRIGLGSPGGGQNVGSTMIQEESKYRVIPLPFGLIQVFSDIDRLNPSTDEFDLVRGIELMASPLHYTFNRDTSTTGAGDFVVDVRNGDLSRDLNDYKGFIPVNQPASEGLYAGNWGGTIKVSRGPGAAFHGIYVGAGPYISTRTEPTVDDRLTHILSAAERVYEPNAQLTAADVTQFQAALAVTGGYRGRFALPSGVGLGSDREGVYVAFNYNYLKGFRYEDMDARLRLDTDRSGLLTVNLTLPPPLLISRTNASDGKGIALDFGVGAVISNWEFGVGANGISNHLDWSDVEQTPYFQRTLISVTGGADLIESVPVPVADVRVELPVDFKANVGYDVDRWAAVAEFGNGFNGQSFHGGGEYRFGRIDVRGGGVYSRALWNPAVGVGFNMSQRVGLDVALYSNSANVERKRNPALAFSIRLNRL
jgi:hypothetical protein